MSFFNDEFDLDLSMICYWPFIPFNLLNFILIVCFYCALNSGFILLPPSKSKGRLRHAAYLGMYFKRLNYSELNVDKKDEIILLVYFEELI